MQGTLRHLRSRPITILYGLIPLARGTSIMSCSISGKASTQFRPLPTTQLLQAMLKTLPCPLRTTIGLGIVRRRFACHTPRM